MGLLPSLRRIRGREILDDPSTPDAVRARAMQDIERSNALFGGRRAVLAALREVLPQLPRRALLLDVGTGSADIAAAARRVAADAGVELTIIGLDESAPLLMRASPRLHGSVAGDALALPFATSSADVVICSQLLHHFFDDDPAKLVAELHRVSRGWVIVGDLQRSRIAAGAFWLASSVLGFHPVTRADGVTSVFRGFMVGELDSLVRHATGTTPVITRGAFWRITATWRKRDEARASR